MFAFLSFLIAVVALSFVCFGLVPVAIGWLYQRILWFSRGVMFVSRMLRSAQRCAADRGPYFYAVTLWIGSAEQREERCTASGTRCIVHL
jgi:hypothetical protein